MSKNNLQNQFSPYDERPLTIPLTFVGALLILDGLIFIVFADWFHLIGYPVGENVLEPIVQMVIGFTLLSNFIFARFLNLFYCSASLLGTAELFTRSGMKNVDFRNTSIFHFVFLVFCTSALILNILKKWKKTALNN
jgi:hypothetical protein